MYVVRKKETSMITVKRGWIVGANISEMLLTTQICTILVLDLSDEVIKHVKPIYLDLIKPQQLEKCLHGKTQNQIESFNSMIWERVPKYGIPGYMFICFNINLSWKHSYLGWPPLNNFKTWDLTGVNNAKLFSKTNALVDFKTLITLLKSINLLLMQAKTLTRKKSSIPMSIWILYKRIHIAT